MKTLQPGSFFYLMKLISTILNFSLLPFVTVAQNYTATNGSSLIGSLNVHNNPAAIVNSPLKWDITLFGFQDKHTTNAVSVFKYSLISNPAKSEYQIQNGNFSRYADLNTSFNLLNARIALNKTSSIAFGANIKSYLSLKTSPYNFVDTLGRFGDFFQQNEGIQNMELDMATSSWAELYAAYGQTVLDNDYSRVNAGVTLKVNRGLSGAFANLANGNFIRNNSNPLQYRITEASLDFAYSSNYDRWSKDKNFQNNSRNFLAFTETGGSLDIGVEYLVKLPSITNVFEDDPYFDYDWKIGFSLLDMGYSQYHFGKYSTAARNVRADITDSILDHVLDSTINNLGDLRDSLTNIFNNIGTYGGKFRVNHPGRLVLNVDKFITESFFINADISVNLSNLSNGPNKRIKDINLLTITPRWETRKKGYYLPVYYNNHNQLWIGGAIRIGPILFGVHNWSNIFSKKKIQRGGGYLAIIVKPSDFNRNRADKRLSCPE